MIRRFVFPILIVMLMLFAACSATAKEGSHARTTEEIEQIIDDYIVNNPDVIERAIVALNEKRQVEKESAARGRILANADKLYAADPAYILGDIDAPITVVEFFDYQCGYCKRSVEAVQALTTDYDGKVRVVLKELPVLSQGSLDAAKAAVAAANQGKYIDMHLALMAHKGTLDGPTINAIAFNVGLDVEKLEADIKSAPVKKLLDDTQALAQELGANGTPAFFVGTTNIAGADLTAVRAAIEAEIKAKGL